MRFLAGLAALILLGSAPGWAQLDSTGLTGSVTDVSGRVIPDVQVVAVEDATGLRRETVSSGQGTNEITEPPVRVYAMSFGRTR